MVKFHLVKINLFWMCSRRDGIGSQKCDELRDWCIENPQELTVSVKDPYTGMTMTTALLNRRLAAFERCYIALMTYDFSEAFC